MQCVCVQMAGLLMRKEQGLKAIKTTPNLESHVLHEEACSIVGLVLITTANIHPQPNL